MRRYAFYLMVIGVGGGIFFWSILGCVELVRNAFDTSNFMGFATLSCFGLVLSGCGYLCFAELSGYFSIRRVEHLARALQGENVASAKHQASRWFHELSLSDVEEIQYAETMQELRNIVEARVSIIDSKVDKQIAKESIVIAAFVGISPWPLVDGGIVAWRQLRLIRSVATMYGVRPSTIGTLRLLRRVLISVVLADVSQHATQWIASKVPSMGGLIPSAGQSFAVLVLTVRVGRACKLSCRPLDTTKTSSPSLWKKACSIFIKRTATKEKRSRFGSSTILPLVAPSIRDTMHSCSPS
jgi:putative membrane protein